MKSIEAIVVSLLIKSSRVPKADHLISSPKYLIICIQVARAVENKLRFSGSKNDCSDTDNSELTDKE